MSCENTIHKMFFGTLDLIPSEGSGMLLASVARFAAPHLKLHEESGPGGSRQTSERNQAYKT